MSSVRASFTMEFSHYDPVPKNVADEVIEEVAKRLAALNAKRDSGLWRIQGG